MSRTSRMLWPVAALAVTATAGYLYAPVRLMALAAVGRSPVCPMHNAVRAAENFQQQVQYDREILAASKLLEKDPAGYHLWETPYGRWWIPEGDDYVLPFNLAEQKRQIYGTGEHGVHSGDVVLDCGANVGVFTKMALDAGAGKVVAIEPAPENIESYKRNFAAQIASGRVVLVPKGVWDKPDTLRLSIDPHNTAADSLVINQKPTNRSVEVPLTTIDALVEELKLDRVDFIKMDIEGAETRALAGAHNTLSRFHPRLALAAYHLPTDPERIPAVVREGWAGYRMECGPCAEAHGRVRPDVLYFR